MHFIFSDGEIEIDVSEEVIIRNHFLSSFAEMEESVIIPPIKNLFNDSFLCVKNYFLPLFPDKDGEYRESEITPLFTEKISFFEFIGDEILLLETFFETLLFFYNDGKKNSSFLKGKLEFGYLLFKIESDDLRNKLMEISDYHTFNEKYIFEKAMLRLHLLFYFQDFSLNFEKKDVIFLKKRKDIILSPEKSGWLLNFVKEEFPRLDFKKISPNSILMIKECFIQTDEEEFKSLLLRESWDYFISLGDGEELRDEISSHQFLTQEEKNIFSVYSFFGRGVGEYVDENSNKILEKVYRLFNDDTRNNNNDSDSDSDIDSDSDEEDWIDIFFSGITTFHPFEDTESDDDSDSDIDLDAIFNEEDEDIEILEFSIPESP